MEVNNQVIEILSDTLCAYNIGSDDHIINDLDADSLDIMELTLKFEKEFGIRIDDDEVDPNFTTVGHLIDFIQEKYEAL